jgi:hypothetical protein
MKLAICDSSKYYLGLIIRVRGSRNPFALPIRGPDVALSLSSGCALQTPDLVAIEQSLTYLRIGLFAFVLVAHHGRICSKVTQSGFIVFQMEVRAFVPDISTVMYETKHRR